MPTCSFFWGGVQQKIRLRTAGLENALVAACLVNAMFQDVILMILE